VQRPTTMGGAVVALALLSGFKATALCEKRLEVRLT
jgi:hypothetical protein